MKLEEWNMSNIRHYAQLNLSSLVRVLIWNSFMGYLGVAFELRNKLQIIQDEVIRELFL